MDNLRNNNLLKNKNDTATSDFATRSTSSQKIPLQNNSSTNKTNQRIVLDDYSNKKNYNKVLSYIAIAFLVILSVFALWYYVPWNNIYNSSLVQGENTEALKSRISQLEEKISNNQAQQERQTTLMINLVEKHLNQQGQQIQVITQQVGDFELLINRWKNRLANPDLLINNIYNHLNLVRSQMILNYSPQQLSIQLETLDSLIEEVSIVELDALRLEIQRLIKHLDIKPSQPIGNWLREIQKAEEKLPLWAQQKNEKFSFTEDGDQLPNNTIILAVEDKEEIETPFWNSILGLLKQSVSNSIKISKKQDNITNNSQFKDEQLMKHFRNRLEYMRLSILSRDWDNLREQSYELNEWLIENLPQAAEELSEKLAAMSQYKPKIINVSLAKALTIIDDYRNKYVLKQNNNKNNISLKPKEKQLLIDKKSVTIDTVVTP